MSDFSQQLKRINDKLQQLLKYNQLLLKDNERLTAELQQVKDNYAGQLARADELEQKVSVLRLAAGQLDESDKKELEKRLNGYIREIDRCITMLGE
jgi:predicted nuclease with TOPRIM domain